MSIAVVMYRNPVEEWFWESGVAYWVIGLGVSLFVAFIGYCVITELIRKWRRKK